MIQIYFRATSYAGLLCQIILFLSTSSGQVHAKGVSNQGSNSALVQAINALLEIPELKSGFQGVYIQSLRDGTILYERNAEQVFLPASNNKLLTSAAALEVLGTQYVYHTRLLYKGEIDSDGILHGDLILQGAGDPILNSEDIDDLAKQAYRHGLRQIEGRLCYDDTLFDQQRLGVSWAWDDEPYSYSAQISALNFNENVIELKAIHGKRSGEPVHVKVSPVERYVKLINLAVTAPTGSKSGLIVDRIRSDNSVTLSGSLALDDRTDNSSTIDVTVDDPARFAAFYTRAALHRTLHTSDRLQLAHLASPPTNCLVLAEHSSPPLSTLLQLLNKPSDNLIAECLLKTVGAAKSHIGSSGVDGTGVLVARDYFKNIGMNLDQLQQVDGSGLSRVNYVSPHNLVILLTHLSKLPDYEVFYDSLPIAGIDGTLAHRMIGTTAANNCHAKTGTMSHVSSLSGYVTTRDGEQLAFSILMNNHLAPTAICTHAQDSIVNLLANYTRKP